MFDFSYWWVPVAGLVLMVLFLILKFFVFDK
jgi:hypothetical protein